MQRADSLEKTLMLGKIEGRRRRDNRKWDSRMASPTQWTWVWAGSGRWCEEGNGNPLQYSCLRNPMDGGAWWAAVYGVAQSRTRLTRLSSSSSWEMVRDREAWRAAVHGVAKSLTRPSNWTICLRTGGASQRGILGCSFPTLKSAFPLLSKSKQAILSKIWSLTSQRNGYDRAVSVLTWLKWYSTDLNRPHCTIGDQKSVILWLENILIVTKHPVSVR